MIWYRGNTLGNLYGLKVFAVLESIATQGSNTIGYFHPDKAGGSEGIGADHGDRIRDRNRHQPDASFKRVVVNFGNPRGDDNVCQPGTRCKGPVRNRGHLRRNGYAHKTRASRKSTPTQVFNAVRKRNLGQL